MFKAELESKLKEIFGLKKISFSQPGESKEHECLFLEIENSWNTIKDGRALSKVAGNGVLFGNGDKIPFGFFSKRIKQAEAALTKDFYFYDFESNTRIYQDIIQLSFSFIYFFNTQYDPAQGTITSVDLILEES